MDKKKTPQKEQLSDYKVYLSGSAERPPEIFFKDVKLSGVQDVRISKSNGELECTIKISLAKLDGYLNVF